MLLYLYLIEDSIHTAPSAPAKPKLACGGHSMDADDYVDPSECDVEFDMVCSKKTCSINLGFQSAGGAGCRQLHSHHTCRKLIKRVATNSWTSRQMYITRITRKHA